MLEQAPQNQQECRYSSGSLVFETILCVQNMQPSCLHMSFGSLHSLVYTANLARCALFGGPGVHSAHKVTDHIYIDRGYIYNI